VKRLILVGLLLLAVALAVAPTTSAYSDTDRRVIRFDGGTFDINADLIVANGTTDGTHWTASDYLPAKLGDFDTSASYIKIHAIEDITFSLTVNSVSIATSATLTSGNDKSYNFSTIISAGVSSDATEYNIDLTVNNSNWESSVRLVADDADVNPYFFNKHVTFAEKDVNTPKVSGIWKVNDTITNDMDVDFTDTNFKIRYPGQCVADNPNTFPWNNTDFTDGTTLYINYQKYGPATTKENIDFTAEYGQVTLSFESDDELDDADWTIKTEDPYWENAFDGLDFDSLIITVNGHELDEDDYSQGSIDIENIDIEQGDNDIIFSWTPAGGGVTPTTTPTTPTTPVITLDTEYGGVPLWAILAIGAVIVIAAIAIIKIEKK